MWVLKIKTDDGIQRVPSSVEQPTFSLLKAALKKFGQDMKNARYIDEDGDQCTLCEATFQDFLGFAIEGPSKQKVLKIVMVAPIVAKKEEVPQCCTPGCTRDTWNGQPGEACCRSCWGSQGGRHGPVCESREATAAVKASKDTPKQRRGKRGRNGKKKNGRGRSRSSSSGSSSSSSSGSSRGGRGRDRRRKNRKSRSRSRSRSSSSSGSSRRSSSSGSSRSSRSSSSGSNGQFHHCSSCRFEDGKITYWLEESFKRYECLTLIPGGSKAVQRAFYGDCNHAFEEGHGKDVTEAVKAVLDCGQPLQAQNKVFGDPLPGIEKMLLIEAAIPPCPVSAEKAEGFIKALREEYVNEKQQGVGIYFEQEREKFEPFEFHILETFEQVVRTALPSKEAAISMLASAWGVKEAPKFEGAVPMEDAPMEDRA